MGVRFIVSSTALIKNLSALAEKQECELTDIKQSEAEHSILSDQTILESIFEDFLFDYRSLSAKEILSRAAKAKRISELERRIKKLKGLIRFLCRKLQYHSINIGAFCREHLRPLFKNMDDTSGSDNKIVFQASLHDFNNYKMFQACLIKHNLYKVSTN